MREEPLSDNLVGVQAQNIYLVNYITKLEFLLTKAREDRKRDLKRLDKQTRSVVNSLYEHEGAAKVNAVQRFIGLGKF